MTIVGCRAARFRGRRAENLMTQARSGNEQRRLHFVIGEAVGDARRESGSDERGVRNVAAQAPPNLVEPTDDGIRLKFGEPLDRNLHVAVLADGCRIVAASRVKQIGGFDFGRNLAKFASPSLDSMSNGSVPSI
jgi:hypothetical protein